MKRMLTAAVCLLLLLTGCGREDPYRVDTVIRIPVNPTEAAAESAIQAAQTAPGLQMTEAEDTEPKAEQTEAAPEEKKPSGGRKPSSDQGSSSGGSSNTPSDPSETDTPVPETEPERYDISGYVTGSLEYAVADAINGAREEAGIAALRMDERLCAIASCRGYELSRLWSHTRPDGRSFTTVLGDYGYGAGTVTELLVYVSGGADGESLVDKWLGSDSHRQSILSQEFTAVGVGIYQTDGYTYICCLLAG